MRQYRFQTSAKKWALLTFNSRNSLGSRILSPHLSWFREGRPPGRVVGNLPVRALMREWGALGACPLRLSQALSTSSTCSWCAFAVGVASFSCARPSEYTQPRRRVHRPLCRALAVTQPVRSFVRVFVRSLIPYTSRESRSPGRISRTYRGARAPVRTDVVSRVAFGAEPRCVGSRPHQQQQDPRSRRKSPEVVVSRILFPDPAQPLDPGTGEMR